MLDVLALARVVRCERVDDPERGTTVMVVHLLVQDGGWTAVTVAMAEHVALPRLGGHRLCDLGVIVVLLELCASQRAELGGLSAQVTRGEIAARAGISVDRLDDRIQLLEHASVLSVERRRRPNGGRHLPSAYTIHEAPPARSSSIAAAPRSGTGRAADRYPQGRASVPAARRTSTSRAARQGMQGGKLVPEGRQTGTCRAAGEYPQGGNAAPSLRTSRTVRALELIRRAGP